MIPNHPYPKCVMDSGVLYLVSPCTKTIIASVQPLDGEHVYVCFMREMDGVSVYDGGIQDGLRLKKLYCQVHEADMGFLMMQE